MITTGEDPTEKPPAPSVVTHPAAEISSASNQSPSWDLTNRGNDRGDVLVRSRFGRNAHHISFHTGYDAAGTVILG